MLHDFYIPYPFQLNFLRFLEKFGFQDYEKDILGYCSACPQFFVIMISLEQYEYSEYS